MKGWLEWKRNIGTWGGGWKAGGEHPLLGTEAEGCSMLCPCSLASKQYLRLCAEMLRSSERRRHATPCRELLKEELFSSVFPVALGLPIASLGSSKGRIWPACRLLRLALKVVEHRSPKPYSSGMCFCSEWSPWSAPKLLSLMDPCRKITDLSKGQGHLLLG